MSDRLERIEQRLDELARENRALVQRLEALEGGRGLRLPEVDVPRPDSRTTGEVVAALQGRWSTLLGRSFLVFAGAFYLRALTDGGTVSHAAGVTLGLVYAAVMLVLADRAAAADQPRSGSAHALVGILIGYPLIWEASWSFEFLSPAASALLLVGFAGFELAVSGRRRQNRTAWISLLFALGIAVSLLFLRRSMLPYGLALVVLAAAADWIAWRDDWPVFAWPAAVLTNLVIAAFTLMYLLSAPPWLGIETLVVPQLSLALVFVGSYVTRHLVMGRQANGFEVAQLSFAMLVGVGGAAAVVAQQAGGLVFGSVALVVAVGFYLLAFSLARRRKVETTGFFLYSTLGAGMLVLGLSLTASTRFGGVILLLVAGAAAWMGRGRRTVILRLHSVLFMASGAILSGLFMDAVRTFSRSAAADWPALGWHVWAFTGLALGTYAILRRQRPDEVVPWAGTWTEVALLFGGLLGLGTLVVGIVGPWTGAGTTEGDPGALAVLRTGVLSVSAIGLALLARRDGWREVRLLVPVILVLTAAKLLIEDLSVGTPGSLVGSFVLYGLALVAAAQRAVAARAETARSTANEGPEEPDGVADTDPADG